MVNKDLFISRELSLPFEELEFRTSRSSGPGGQHANKTETRVSLRWNIDQSKALTESQRRRLKQNLASLLSAEHELILSVEDFRSQHRNKALAAERLVLTLRKALRRKKRRIKTKPSKSAIAKRVDSKKRIGAKKRLRRRASTDD
ncbi:MAG: aminoacyl-tRNA hydrolase [Myxococcales bacterium]|nr:aminoacyl-tRNA hydrolase [Myxococcales bacterium]